MFFIGHFWSKSNLEVWCCNNFSPNSWVMSYKGALAGRVRLFLTTPSLPSPIALTCRLPTLLRLNGLCLCFWCSAGTVPTSLQKTSPSSKEFHKTTIRQPKSLGKFHKTTIRQLHKTTRIPWESVQIVAFVGKRKEKKKLNILLCEAPLSGGPLFVRIPKESELSYGVVL